MATSIDDLYALPPGEFTAARNAAAKSDASLKKLAKPSAAAWALNHFAREHADRLTELFTLGQELRDAQEDLDAASLRELGAQRRRLVTALARDMVKQAGVSASALEDVEATLHAALADEKAADAVASGRLVRALSSTGVEAVDLSGALAGDAPAASARTKRDPAAARAEAEEDEAAAAAARTAVEEATRQVEDNAEAQDELRARIEALQGELEEGRAELRDARSRGGFLNRERQRLEAELSAAEATAEKSRRRWERARKR